MSHFWPNLVGLVKGKKKNENEKKKGYENEK